MAGGCAWACPLARLQLTNALTRKFSEIPWIKKRLEMMEEKMNHSISYMKLATGLVSAMLAGWLFVACSQTAAPAPNIVQRVEGEQATPPPPSGFLGSDYSLLQPPSSGSVPGQKAMLAYTNPNANFSQYN